MATEFERETQTQPPLFPTTPLQTYIAAVVDFSSPRFELICVIPPNEKQMSLK